MDEYSRCQQEEVRFGHCQMFHDLGNRPLFGSRLERHLSSAQAIDSIEDLLPCRVEVAQHPAAVITAHRQRALVSRNDSDLAEIDRRSGIVILQTNEARV